MLPYLTSSGDYFHQEEKINQRVWMSGPFLSDVYTHNANNHAKSMRIPLKKRCTKMDHNAKTYRDFSQLIRPRTPLDLPTPLRNRQSQPKGPQPAEFKNRYLEELARKLNPAFEDEAERSPDQVPLF